jgi:GNAT superfamily N-acetyltransferase
MNELERVEAAALRDAVVRSGGRAELVGGALCTAQPALPIHELNRALPVGEALDLAAIAAWYDGMPHMVATAVDLASQGYLAGDPWMKFEHDGTPAPAAAAGLEVKETLDPSLFGAVAAEGSGLPPEAAHVLGAIVGAPGWHCFVAFSGSEAAGAGALYVDGTSAWVGIGATRPSFRRRGAQSAVLAARIERALGLGVTLVTTETGAHDEGPSFRNIERAGFRQAYVRPNWRSPG